jgi:hypothetical protein
MAGYRISSTERGSRWISSMNRTSPSWRSVSSAARSPARVSTGPEVIRRPTPISAATIPASDVLPRPGRAGEQEMVHRLLALPGRLEHDPRCSTSWPGRGTPRACGAGARPRRPPRPDHHGGHQPRVGVERPRRLGVAEHLTAGASGLTRRTSRGARHRLASSRNANRSISSTPTSSRNAVQRTAGSRRGRSRARPGQRALRNATAAGDRHWSNPGRRARIGELEPALEVDHQPGRRLASDTGHGAQRVQILLQHGRRKRGGGEHGQDGQRQGGSDAVGPEQHLRSSAARRRG